MKSIMIAIWYFFFVSIAFSADSGFDDLEIKHEFKPGFGEEVADVVTSEIETAIIHSDAPLGYRAEAGLPLYNKDTVVTGGKGGMSFELEDESTTVVASNSKLIINESVYNPGKKERSAILSLEKGAVRLRVNKQVGFKKNDFKLKTKNAVLSVKGSDFVVDTDELQTRVSTMKDTRLLLTLYQGCDSPDDIRDGKCTSKQFELSENQHATFQNGMLEMEITELTIEDIENHNSRFPPVKATGKKIDQGGVYYSGKSYETPADGALPDTLSGMDVELEFANIEDEVADDVDLSADELPSYPFPQD